MCAAFEVDSGEESAFPSSSGSQQQQTMSVPPVPDRKYLERQLSDLNSKIAALQSEKRAILGLQMQNQGEDLPLSPSRMSLKELKTMMMEKKEEAKTQRKLSKDLTPELAKVKAELDVATKEIREIEAKPDWIMKNEGGLQSRLKTVTNAYESRSFKNARDETRYITEINKLNRAIKLAATHNTLTEKRRVVENQHRKLYEELDVVRKTCKRAQFRQTSLKKELSKKQSRLTEIISELNHWRKTKRDIIQGYDEHKRSYLTWKREFGGTNRQRQQKSGGARVGSRGGRRKTPLGFGKSFELESDSELTDEEELEPFYAEKRDCRALLGYLNQLLGQMDSSFLEDPELLKIEKGSSTESEASASLALRRKANEEERERGGGQNFVVGSPKVTRSRRSGKRRKPTQMINHPAVKVGLFEQFKLPIPSSYQDVPASIESVKDLLKFYEDQTEIPIVENPADEADLLSFISPSSGSEITTTDSALASTSMSESASFSLSLTQPEEAGAFGSELGLGISTSQSAGLLGLCPTSPPMPVFGLDSIADEGEQEGKRAVFETWKEDDDSSSAFTTGLEQQRSLSDSAGSGALASFLADRRDGATTPKLESRDDAEVDSEVSAGAIRVRLRQVELSDEGIAELAERSKESSANSAADDPQTQCIRRLFVISSISDPVGEEDVDLPEINRNSDEGEGKFEGEVVTKL